MSMEHIDRPDLNAAQQLFDVIKDEPVCDDPKCCSQPMRLHGMSVDTALTIAKYAVGGFIVAVVGLLVFLLIFGGVLG